MLRRLPLILGMALILAGCARLAESRLNPFNWFGPSTSIAVMSPDGELRPLVPEGQQRVTLDSRGLIAEVTDLVIDRSADGAIVRATGLAATPGHYNAQLVRTGLDAGVLTLEFRVAAPDQRPAAGAVATRTITVATRISNAELASVRTVRVVGQGNIRTASR
jgi:hypothetical protein